MAQELKTYLTERCKIVDKALGKFLPTAVSYTHLTLPTKA